MSMTNVNMKAVLTESVTKLTVCILIGGKEILPSHKGGFDELDHNSVGP